MVGENADDDVVLHFYDFAAKEPHYCCLFRSSVTASATNTTTTATTAATIDA